MSRSVAIAILYADGVGAAAIDLMVLMLNLRHVLYGLSLGRQLGRPPRPLLPAMTLP